MTIAKAERSTTGGEKFSPISTIAKAASKRYRLPLREVTIIPETNHHNKRMLETCVLHIPHSGLALPAEYLGEILVSDGILRQNISREADLFTDHLFHINGVDTLKPRFSRNICDVERFCNDNDEPESRRGRGLFYTHFEDGTQFKKYDKSLRQKVVTELYDKHHADFTRSVENNLKRYGLCCIIDCHSFSDSPGHPDFCIGTDPFHTAAAFSERLYGFIEQAGYSVRINFPYSGSIVPMASYQKDSRVKSIMIEVNKRLYMDEATFSKNDAFDNIRGLCLDMVRLIAASDDCKQ